ncbi:hypothetical protein [Marinobacterium sediminicola]|uniref:Plasmid replication DNA-binding protein KfrA n=1 Tax=Marinobacterium sediminicola TaxID=518898 RepID=A0ABY1RX84_9GAMM|nr:hypothetical protein [Marinobacterium sediminicola]ULG67834.1 hypothetical protein LN244_08870 [Marinobacterium sediminicola]SMR71485.1 hypothetical protein SAMN04487964_102140 [Marinobacterium sediminicola]
MDSRLKNEFFASADRYLITGTAPTPELMRESQTALDSAQIELLLSEWWQALPSRMRLLEQPQASVPEMPDSMHQLFVRLWQQAVAEAAVALEHQGQQAEPVADVQLRSCDESLKRARDEVAELEQRCREQEYKLSQLLERQGELEAELQQLRHDKALQSDELNKEGQIRANVEQELAQLRKTYEDAQRVFDQRVRDEQLHNLEALAKADVETRHFRNALERLRDESGRKEADLTRELHELRNRLGKSEAKAEALGNQVRAHEEAMREFQSQDAQQQRQQAQINAQLLSASNRSKRSEEQVRQLEERLQVLNRKQAEASSENARREAQLRAQLQQSEDEVQKVKVRAQVAEKRAEALEEEIRRLKQRA